MDGTDIYLYIDELPYEQRKLAVFNATYYGYSIERSQGSLDLEGEVNKYLGLKSQDSFGFLEDRLRAPANDPR